MLEDLGVGDLFESTRDLSSLSSKPTKLDRAVHKSRIEVTEEGTEAASSTVLFSFRSSRPIEPAQFNCNHPFIYIIHNKAEGATLFMGVFRSPNWKKVEGTNILFKTALCCAKKDVQRTIEVNILVILIWPISWEKVEKWKYDDYKNCILKHVKQ